MKKIILFLSLILCAFSQELSINDKINNFSLANQFDEKKTIDSKINTIIVSFEKDTGKEVNEFLEQKTSDFLENIMLFLLQIFQECL